MFVAPVIVIAGFVFRAADGFPRLLPEIIAVFASMFLMSQIVNDGTCTWEEGAELLGVYTTVCNYILFIDPLGSASKSARTKVPYWEPAERDFNDMI